MKKDIFIDANVANKFANTQDENLIALINWLTANDENNPDGNAYLMVSNYIRKEYFDGNMHCDKQYSICTIYAQLQAQDRLHVKTKKELEEFKIRNVTKKCWNKLTCNAKDREHIPLVLLSDRKMVLSEDDNFINDLVEFPKFGKLVCCAKSPEDLDYE